MFDSFLLLSILKVVLGYTNLEFCDIDFVISRMSQHWGLNKVALKYGCFTNLTYGNDLIRALATQIAIETLNWFE